jgi:hypothetical protein
VDMTSDVEQKDLTTYFHIGCPFMLYLNMLALFNSVQKFTCGILEKAVTISINQVLESIHPVDKDRFDHFD